MRHEVAVVVDVEAATETEAEQAVRTILTENWLMNPTHLERAG